MFIFGQCRKIWIAVVYFYRFSYFFGTIRNPFRTTRRSGGAKISIANFHIDFCMTKYRHRYDIITLVQSYTSNACRRPSTKHSDFRNRKTDAHAFMCHQQNIIVFCTCPNPHKFVTVIQFHRNLAIRHNIGEIIKRVPADVTTSRGEDDVKVAPSILFFWQHHDSRNSFTFFERQ